MCKNEKNEAQEVIVPLERLQRLINKKFMSNDDLVDELDILVEACDPDDLEAFVDKMKVRISEKIKQEILYMEELKISLQKTLKELDRINPLVYDKAI